MKKPGSKRLKTLGIMGMGMGIEKNLGNGKKGMGN